MAARYYKLIVLYRPEERWREYQTKRPGEYLVTERADLKRMHSEYSCGNYITVTGILDI